MDDNNSYYYYYNIIILLLQYAHWKELHSITVNTVAYICHCVLERSPLEDIKSNPHPAVSSCGFANYGCHHTLPCYLVSLSLSLCQRLHCKQQGVSEKLPLSLPTNRGEKKTKVSRNTWVSFHSWRCSSLTPNKGLLNGWRIKLNSEQTTL